MKFFQSNEMNDKKLFLLGLLNSLGTVVYIIAVAAFLNNAQRIFGDEKSFFIPIIMLMLFVLSALITSLLILGKPVIFYFEGRKKDSVKLLIYTIISFAGILALVILAYLGLK
ncbi:MAG: hypothetical protein Q7K35_04490 [bacterium]|nr:hypothetical protein [bacterium]